mmetsp:Transcript_27265/g.47055  ORF Transcript_27265/g.47055 Transcript_27265/m.47055 type:complete len:308 (-) Transcript_27265:463-1386(-)|eukprot:CAMPEP_0196651804 /NCGR_PEP_ID=MMETSP1086-20130531/943_1 /TAXON_ID=77921 /ORGANISM="Cyanoptyche  gloeocystis , Strain SAG4.97" /LENGTH=307 /DNA_ID=CAMNT_0041982021 /DNA_START=49 /DNA_END=972 /DNA_ORIENTATION=+
MSFVSVACVGRLQFPDTSSSKQLICARGRTFVQNRLLSREGPSTSPRISSRWEPVPVRCAATSADFNSDSDSVGRRRILRAIAAAVAVPALAVALPLRTNDQAALAAGSEPAVTEKLYLDFSVGGEKIGRVVIGMYGDAVPQTVKEFKRLVTKGNPLFLKGSSIHKVVPGVLIEGGKVRSANREPLPGAVYVGANYASTNPELQDPSSRPIKHDVPGLLSIGPNGLQFDITTAPVPELNGVNVVAGRVLQGMEVLESIGQVPIVEPTGDKQFFVGLGKAIGDPRAKGNAFYKPLRKVRIVDCGPLTS